ncbi:MAG: RCC1 repeat-containing protein [Kiritimatiellae bacterium]|nr:RCC1 repeat-containing protein [Kiritimatiellia bacterium]
MTSLAAGENHSLVLKDDGTVWAWGCNYSGQLGDGTWVSTNRPVQVSDLSEVSAVAGGGNYSLALKNDGAVWAWGTNSQGQLGDGTWTTTNRPVQVVGLSEVTVIAGSGSANGFSLALKNNGTVWAWGCNENGQLGDGTTNNANQPVQVVGLSDVKAIAGGGGANGFSLALKNDGTIWAWGNNTYGQLGDGTTINKVSPIQVVGLSGMSAVAGGQNHSLALKNDGTVWAWGSNGDGQLGDGTKADANRARQTIGLSNIIAIAAGEKFSMAMDRDGTVWAWGSGYYGQLDNGILGYAAEFGLVNGLTEAVSVAGGMYHSMALKNDGTVWAWGYNYYGQLGDGTATDTNHPVQALNLNGILNVAGGMYHSMALRNNGTVWAWGDNTCGQLGDGTTINRIQAVQVSVLADVSVVAAGGYHSLALKNNGAVWAWGTNNYGQLGDGTWTTTNHPVQTVELSGVTVIAGGGGANGFSLALKNDGTVWAWGCNYYGQLGNGTNGSSASTNRPVQVIGLSGMTAISGGGANGFSLALKDDGTVWAWGYNYYGQLGNGTNGSYADTNRPVQVIGLSDVSAVAAGENHSLALKNDGAIWAWGNNTYGQLGDGTLTSTNQPVQVKGLANAIAVAAGDNHSMALRSDGSIVAWGYNEYGQLGKGITPYSLLPLAVPLEPNTPTSLTASDGAYADKVRLSWDAMTNVAGYTIWRSITNATNSAALIAGGITTINYNDTNAVPGGLYYYWVQATNTCGTSPFSSSDSGWRLDISSGVCADYDGDRKADPAIYDEATGTWKIRLSSANYYLIVTTLNGLGGRGWASVSADYDGDRKADPAVYQELTGSWMVLFSKEDYAVQVVLSQFLGGIGYSAMPADYDRCQGRSGGVSTRMG